jgi:hypothetical protein
MLENVASPHEDSGQMSLQLRNHGQFPLLATIIEYSIKLFRAEYDYENRYYQSISFKFLSSRSKHMALPVVGHTVGNLLYLIFILIIRDTQKISKTFVWKLSTRYCFGSDTFYITKSGSIRKCSVSTTLSNQDIAREYVTSKMITKYQSEYSTRYHPGESYSFSE